MIVHPIHIVQIEHPISPETNSQFSPFLPHSLNVKTNSKLLAFERSTALLQGRHRPQKKTSMNDEQRYRALAARATNTTITTNQQAIITSLINTTKAITSKPQADNCGLPLRPPRPHHLHPLL